MQRVLHLVGARPNFMKIAPVMAEIARYGEQFQQILVHTGQHYDEKMSTVFFDELGLPKPEVNLEVGSGSHARQTAEIMQRFEPVLLDYRPDWVLVPGDVNSTMAGAIVTAKAGIRLAHLEAGVRSFDRSMPEEINRVVTDQLSDLLLTPTEDAKRNLLREGVSPEKIHFVGNVAIDTLKRLLPKAAARWPRWQSELSEDLFVLVTLHRPGNVDNDQRLGMFIATLQELAAHVTVVFPVHPRTRFHLHRLGLPMLQKRLRLIEPVGYLDFVALQSHAALVITDSGGVQAESTFLGVACFTVRPNTEWTVTLEHGTNTLIPDFGPRHVPACLARLSAGRQRSAGDGPPYWDGNSASRVVAALGNAGLQVH
jgi:UDP-N-acetylglucosamine 2-epimerase (non-hydrolysing)